MRSVRGRGLGFVAARDRVGVFAVLVTLVAGGVVAVPEGASAGVVAARGISAAALPPLPGGNLHPVVPYRIVDTRNGTGGFSAPVGAGRMIDIAVLGKGPVPASGVSGIVLNVTATAATASTFVTVWPSGLDRPTASNLNLEPGSTAANLVQLKLGTGGKVSVFNSAGSTHFIVDVTGWIGPEGEAGTAGLFHAVLPSRTLDTRSGLGAAAATVGPGGQVALQVTGRGGVPASGVGAVALNVTVTAPTESTFVTAYPSGSTRPLASNLNARAGQTVANRVVVKVGADGKVVLYNYGGSLHLIADVGGWYTDGTDPAASGGRFVGVKPVRILDTRSAGGPLKNQGIVSPKVAGANSIPGIGSQVPGTSVVANLTVTQPSGPGYLTAFPSQAARPLASDVNFATGQTVPNLIITKLGPNGRVSVFDAVGGANVHVIVDVLGYYAGDVVFSDTAKNLRASDLTKLTTPVDAGTTTLVFDPIPAVLTGVQVGDTLGGGISAMTPNGLLKKVVAVSTSGTTLTLTVENGSLGDVVLLGDLNGTAQLNSTNVQGASPAAFAGGPHADGVTLSRAISLDLAATFPPPPSTYALEIKGSAKFEASATIDAHFGYGYGLDLNAGVSFSSELDATVAGTATYNHEDVLPLGKQAFEPIPFAIAGWPVFVVPVVDVSLKTTSAIEGKISGGIQKKATVTAGIGYKNQTFTPYADVVSDPASLTGPDATVTASLKAQVDAKTELLLYGIAGPSITTSPYVKVSATSTNFDTCLDIKLEYGVEVSAAAKLVIFGRELGEFSATVADVSSVMADKPVGDCAGWTGTLTINEDWYGLHIHAVVTRATDGTLTWSGTYLSQGIETADCNGQTASITRWAGYNQDLSPNPVVNQPLDPTSYMDLPAWIPWDPPNGYVINSEAYASAHWSGCGSGTANVDLFDLMKCNIWPAGRAPEGSTHLVGTNGDTFRTYSWDFTWTGLGTPETGPTPEGCTVG